MPGLLLFAFAAAAAPDLSWLAGDWVHCDGPRIVEERWLGPIEGVLIGANLNWNGRRAGFEFFRVAKDAQGTLTFFAQPGGRPPVAFPAREVAPGKIVFENAAHDFPQRITYRRDDAGLHARVEGRIDGKLEAEEWHFRAAGSSAGPRCTPQGVR